MAYMLLIGEEEAAELTRVNLADSLERVLRMGDDDEAGRALVAALSIVHEYYSTVEQHQALIDKLKDDLQEFDDRLIEDIMGVQYEGDVAYGVKNVDVTEHDDGTATISVDLDEQGLNLMATKGIEYAILQEMLGNPSMEDLLRWVERGKQEENTDDIVERFNEAKARAEMDLE
jgi:guanylate kinase